jgi:hypothetical protein
VKPLDPAPPIDINGTIKPFLHDIQIQHEKALKNLRLSISHLIQFDASTLRDYSMIITTKEQNEKLLDYFP